MKATTVLVVEDDLHAAKVLRKILARDRMLRYFDLNVVTAEDGYQGLEAFREHRPVLVITDLLMPRMDGFEFVKRLRAEEGGENVSILVTSAVFRESPDLRRLQRQQNVEFQPKPFSPHNLAQRIRHLLRSVGVGRKRAVKTEAVTPTNRPAAERAAGRPERPPRPRRSSMPPQPAAQRRAPRAPAKPPAEPTPRSAEPTPPPVAKAKRPPAQAQRGEINASATLARMLLEALERQWSGTVDIRRGKVQKVLYLLNGQPIFIQSNLRAETLGQLLVRRGGLTADQDRQVLASAQQQGIKYGEALVGLKLMTESDVMAELIAQTRFKLVNCLRWPEGSWTFTPDPDVGRKVPHCTVDPIDVVFDGLRSTFDVEQVLTRLGKSAGGGEIELLPTFEPYRQAFVAIFGDMVLSQIESGCTLDGLTQHSAFAIAVAQVDILEQCDMLRIKPAETVSQRWASPADSLPLKHLTLPKKQQRPPTEDAIEIVVGAATRAAAAAPLEVVTRGPGGRAPGADASLEVDVDVNLDAPSPAATTGRSSDFAIDLDLDMPSAEHQAPLDDRQPSLEIETGGATVPASQLDLSQGIALPDEEMPLELDIGGPPGGAIHQPTSEPPAGGLPLKDIGDEIPLELDMGRPPGGAIQQPLSDQPAGEAPREDIAGEIPLELDIDEVEPASPLANEQHAAPQGQAALASDDLSALVDTFPTADDVALDLDDGVPPVDLELDHEPPPAKEVSQRPHRPTDDVEALELPPMGVAELQIDDATPPAKEVSPRPHRPTDDVEALELPPLGAMDLRVDDSIPAEAAGSLLAMPGRPAAIDLPPAMDLPPPMQLATAIEEPTAELDDVPPPADERPIDYDDVPPPVDEQSPDYYDDDDVPPPADEPDDDVPPPADEPDYDDVPPPVDDDDVPPPVDDDDESPPGDDVVSEEEIAGLAGGPPALPEIQSARPTPPPEELEIARQAIDSFYLRLHDADHYQVLGVIQDTGTLGVEVAHQVKRRQFNLERYRGMDLGTSYGHLEQIIERLDEAFAVLSDDARRATYDEERRAARRASRSPALEAETLFREAEVLFAAERYEEAAEAFGAAAKLDEHGEYLAREALARFMARGHDAESALEAMVALQEVLASDPEQTEAHLAAAAITRMLGDDDETLEHLQAVLRIDPSHRDAFDGLEAVLLDLQRASELEVHYRRTIHRLGDRDPAWAGTLWRRLVVLYREGLDDPKKAKLACETALRLNPGDPELRALLRQLDRLVPTKWPEAVLGLRSLLRSSPDDPSPLHEIFEIHRAAGREDAALIAAGAAVLRGDATDEERQHYEERHGGFRRVEERLSPDDERLRHPAEEPRLTTLIERISPLIELRSGLLLGDFGLAEDDLDPEPPPEDLDQTLTYVCAQLDVARPQLVLRPELAESVQPIGASRPLLLVSSEAVAADRLRTRLPELCFSLARAVGLLSPRYAPVIWQPDEKLLEYILASVLAVDGGAELPAGIPAPAPGLVEQIRRSEPDEGFEEAARSLGDDLGSLALEEWRQGIRRSVDRAALVLANDLVQAGELLTSPEQGALLDLVDFALSEAYDELRRELGLSV